MEKSKVLLSIIGRFDNLYSSTNAKSSLILAFNTIVFSGMILEWDDITKLYNNNRIISLIDIILFLLAFLALTSSFFMFKVVVPYLKSPKKIGEYHSVFFFEHICEYNTEDDYLNAINTLDDTKISKDIAFQAYALAKGLKDKYQNSKIGFMLIIYGHLPLFTIAIILKIIDALI